MELLVRKKLTLEKMQAKIPKSMHHGFELELGGLMKEHRSADALKIFDKAEITQLADQMTLRSKTVEFHKLQLLPIRYAQKAILSDALHDVKMVNFESKMSSYRDFRD